MRVNCQAYYEAEAHNSMFVECMKYRKWTFMCIYSCRVLLRDLTVSLIMDMGNSGVNTSVCQFFLPLPIKVICIMNEIELGIMVR